MSKETNSSIGRDALAAREHLKAGDVPVQLDDAGVGLLATRVLHHSKIPKGYACSPDPDYIADDLQNTGVPDEGLEHL
jgi:hypothetical protein